MYKLIAIPTLFFTLNSFCQTVLMEEGFDAGISSTWTIVDNDGLTPSTQVSQFSSGWIYFTENGDTCAASTSYYDPAGQSEDYLITPKMSLATFSKLTWRGKSFDASYPDGYYVLISSTDSLIGSFTDTLLTIDSEFSYWQNHSIHLDIEGYANQNVFIAFRNLTNDGYILQLDDINVYVSDNASVQHEEIIKLTIYPNPATDFIVVQPVNNEPFSIEIRSLDGRLVSVSSSTTVEVSHLDNGTYILSYISETSILSTPFIKQ